MISQESMTRRPAIRLLPLSALFLVAALAVLALVIVPVPQVQAQSTAWVAQFYNTPDLTGPVVATATYLDALNENWGSGQPTDGLGNTLTAVNADNFSARFTATVSLTAGLYEFVITADDGARLSLDGLVVLDEFASTGLTTSSAVVNISDGPVTIIVDYVDRTDQAVLLVQWFPTTGTDLAPTPTAAPVATGSVVRVRGLAVRTGPFLGASMVAVARPDNTYTLLARNEREGLFTWYQMQIDEDTVGWSSGRYMEVTGNLDALPFQDTVFTNLPAPEDKGVRGVTRSVMNFRELPSPRTNRIGQIPWGDEVIIVGRTVQGGRDFWYRVVYNGQTGWILAAYVGITNGLIDAVPIY